MTNSLCCLRELTRVLGFYRIVVCGAFCVCVWTSLSEIKVMYVCCMYMYACMYVCINKLQVFNFVLPRFVTGRITIDEPL